MLYKNNHGKSKVMKKSTVFLVACGLFMSHQLSFAIENINHADTENSNGAITLQTKQPQTVKKGISHRLLTSEKKENDEQTEQKQQKESQIPELNKNILTPNESPGMILDPQRTRRYYESVEGAHRTDMEKPDKEQKVIEEDNFVLPGRVQEGGISVHIDKVEMTESAIFTAEEISKFKALIEGKDVTEEDLNNFVNLINALYMKKGVITARAFIQESNLSTGVLKIELMEAKISNVSVEGNRFNRKWFLKSQISEKPGDVLDLKKLETDLKNFNKNARSVSMSAKLKPGEEYGTTEVVLQADEKLPYHFSASFDSFGRETTGLLRGGIMASADTLFGFQDRGTFGLNKSRSAISPFVDYNIPINRKGTRAGVSYMYGKNKVSSGQYQNFDLEAKTHVLSTYITHPLINSPKGALNFNTSANMKFSDAFVSGFKYSSFNDYNIAIGFGGHKNFQRSVLYGSIYSTNGIIDDRMRGNSKFFTKINADGYYIHYLPKGIIATFKAGGQYSPHDIAYVEQYQIGGISSVRGYSESLLLAPSSYFSSFEFLFPIPFLPETIHVPFGKEGDRFRLRDSFKLALFWDNGAIFPHKGSVGTMNFLMSAGAGIRMAFSKYFTARFYVGIPLMNTKQYQQANARLHFDVIVSPF